MARDGDQVRAHLRDALIVGGRVVAPAGSPIIIKISNVYGAKAGDIDGSVDIFFGALTLAGGATLPLRTPTHHLTVNVSAGEASTAGITDTLKDIFIPGHQIFRLFRKGANVELAAGAIVRARTAAIIDASKAGAIAVVTPPPFNLGADVPHADYKPLPFETAPPKRGAPTPTPLPTPTPTPLPTPT
ncbi:MAG: hypothetical protein DLM50_02430 [Candidatus Meridianibacter frigidus]|nr:MAG: hypothetical protein DLM50_02430 [Candidatus Eremiobacteraeota bacterium]